MSLAEKASNGERLLILATEAGANNNAVKQKEYLDQLVAAYPDDERAHFNLGGYYFGQQDFAKAIEHYKKATELAPTYSTAYNLLGYSYRQSADYDNADIAVLSLKNHSVKVIQRGVKAGTVLVRLDPTDLAVQAPLRRDRHPAHVYVAGLSVGSRRTMVQALTDYWTQVEKILDLGLLLLELGESTLRRAHAIRQSYGLMTLDSVMAALLEEYGIAPLASHDRSFDCLPAIRVHHPSDIP